MNEPVLRVVRGEPTDVEVVALVRVLSELSTRPQPPGSGAGSASGSGSGSRWSDRAAQLRSPLPHGPHAWRAATR